MERRRGQLVELRCGKSDAGALGGDHASPEADEQRRGQAGTAPLLQAAVDHDDGATVGIRIERDVGYPAVLAARILANPHLPTRDGLEGARASAGAGPHRLALPGG